MDTNNKTQQSIYEDFFNHPRLDYDDWLLSPNDYLSEKYFARLKPRKNATILEIGVGRNPFLGRIGKKYGMRCFGLDLSANAIRAQKHSRPSPAWFTQGLGEKLPFRDNVFDYVVAIGVLEHVSDMTGALSEIRRVMSPLGKCLIAMPCQDFKYSWFGRLQTFTQVRARSWFVEVKREVGHDYEIIPTRQGWVSHVKQAGLTACRVAGSDILVDALFMYYLYPVIGRSYYSAVKYINRVAGRRKQRQSNETTGQLFTTSTTSDGKIAPPCLSPVRIVLGLGWRHIMLQLFRVFLIPERIISRLPIGATVFIYAQKL